jgi:SPOR domain
MVNPDRNLYEPPYDDALLYDGDLEPERPRSRPLVVLLGTVVLAAFAGVVWVAYNQGVKQGQGVPPMLVADGGPTRIVPDQLPSSSNPAPDKSYERLWGEAPESDGQVQVLPQPEQPRAVPSTQELASLPANVPVQTAPTESAGGQLGSKASDFNPPASGDPRMDSTTGPVSTSPRAVTNPPALFGPKPQSEDITAALPPVESVAAPRAMAPTPNPAVAAPITPRPAVIKPTAAKPIAAAPVASTPDVTAPVQVAPSTAKSTPVVAVAPPVATKPTTSIAEPAAPASVESRLSAIAPAKEIAPVKSTSSVAGGSTMIQLGSFPNDALAASAWSKIKSGNASLLDGFSPSIKPAEIPGKGTWYRLRVGGFADKSAAAGVCEQLKATGQACIIAGK